eukprot:1174475-Pyramimonas_sp.AAC.1
MTRCGSFRKRRSLRIIQISDCCNLLNYVCDIVPHSIARDKTAWTVSRQRWNLSVLEGSCPWNPGSAR